MNVESFLVGKGTLDAFMPLLDEGARELAEREDCLIAGACVDKQAAGAAILLLDEDISGSGQILHFFVSDKFRRMGVGTELLNRCLRILRQFAVSTMDCVVMGGTSEGSGEGDLEQFFTAWGMEKDPDEGVAGSFTLDDVAEAGKLGENDTAACMPLGKIKPGILDKGRDGLIYNGDWQQADQELSFAYVSDQRIRAVFLVREHAGSLFVEWMEVEKGGNPKWLLSLMERSLSVAGKRYPGDTAVSFTAWNESAIKLIDYLLRPRLNTTKISRYSISDEAFRLKEV